MQYCDGTNWRVMLGSGAIDPSLSTLTDVDDALAPADGNVLTYDSARGEWTAGAAGIGVEDDPQVGTLTPVKWCATNVGGTAIDCTQNAPVTAEADPRVATTTADYGCYGTGTTVTCADSEFRWDSANHRLGIGIAPTVPLHIRSLGAMAIAIETPGVPFHLQETDLAAGTPGKYWRIPLDGGQLRFDADPNGDGSFSGYVAPLRLFPDGKVGIGGTPVPAATLHVTGTAKITGALDMSSQKITALATPTVGTDAATKAYVDGLTGANESDPQVGTLTTTKWCVTNAGGTAIDCTANAPVTAEADPAVGTLTANLFCQANAGGTAVDCNDTAATMRTNLGLGAVALLAAEADPAVGTLTANRVCQANAGATAIDCNTAEGSGGGLDADLWDGQQFGSYLNQALLTSSSPAFGDLTLTGGLTMNGHIMMGGTTTEARTVFGDDGTGNYDLGVMRIYGRTSVGDGRIDLIAAHGANDANPAIQFVKITSGGGTTTVLGRFNGNGNLVVVGSATTCTIGGGTGATMCGSDLRLKKDILPIDGALDKLGQINGVTFHWKDPAKESPEHIGVIAQDVQKVFPQAVAEQEGYLAVDYAVLVAPLIEAVKELKVQNERLRADFEAYVASHP